MSEEPEYPPHCNPCQAAVGRVTPANQVPPMTLPTETSGEYSYDPWEGWILEELNLHGLEEWPKEEHDQASLPQQPGPGEDVLNQTSD